MGGALLARYFSKGGADHPTHFNPLIFMENL
jgi:hypothetical protein